MKLSEFILLDIEMKGKVLLHEGIFLEKRRYGLFLAFLFQMDSFYVEMRCNTETRQVEEYRIFEATKFLNLYLEEISIDVLLT